MKGGLASDLNGHEAYMARVDTNLNFCNGIEPKAANGCLVVRDRKSGEVAYVESQLNKGMMKREADYDLPKRILFSS